MKTFGNKKTMALAVVAAQIAIFDSPVTFAQPMLEEIVVTARKKTETLMEAPLSVTAVSGRSMDNMGITNLEQLSSQVPGLTLGNNAQTTNIFIRGIGSGTNTGFEQSAGMYVDGIYQIRSRQFSLSMVDVQQVEVLRGPQSLLFGKNTIAGAIKVETASPVIGDGFNGSFSLDYEPEQETPRATAVLSGDLTDDLAGRIVLRYQETEGYIANNAYNTDQKSGEDSLARATLVWAPTDTLQITGKLAYIQMEGEGSSNVNQVIDPSLLATFGQPGNSLAATSVLGTLASLQVPGYQESTGSKEFDSWLGNTSWFPNGADHDNLDYLQASMKVDWDIGDYTVTSLTGYTDFDQDRLQDTDFQPGNIAGTTENDDLDLFSQELRIASNYDGRFNFTAGMYYEEQEGIIGSGNTTLDGSIGGVFGTLDASGLAPVPPGTTFADLGVNSLWNGALLAPGSPLVGAEISNLWQNQSNQVDNNTLAVFLEVAVDLTESLTLEVGARYSEDEKTVRKTNELGIGIPGDGVVYVNNDGSLTEAGAADPLNAALMGVIWGNSFGRWTHDEKLKRNEDHVDPSVRLTWNVTDNTMSYLSYSTGYKSGGFSGVSDAFNQDGSPTPGAEFEDENATAWELGVKTSFWDQRARVSAAVFNTQIEDLQVSTFTGISFQVGNAAEMTSRGVEFDTQVAVTESLELGGAIAFLDNEYDEYETAPCTIYQQAATPAGEGCFQNFKGEPGAFAPEWSGNLYAAYEYPLGDNLMLNLRGDASFKDDHFTSADNDPNSIQESYWKYNARISLSDQEGKWEVAAYGRNLTDEATISYSLSAPLGAGIYGNGREEPRVLGVQARYNF